MTSSTANRNPFGDARNLGSIDVDDLTRPGPREMDDAPLDPAPPHGGSDDPSCPHVAHIPRALRRAGADGPRHGPDEAAQGLYAHPRLRADRRVRAALHGAREGLVPDRKSTRLNSSHSQISYAVFCLKKKNSAWWRSRIGVESHAMPQRMSERRMDD